MTLYTIIDALLIYANILMLCCSALIFIIYPVLTYKKKDKNKLLSQQETINKMLKISYPYLICHDCGITGGTHVAGISAYYKGTCGWCNKIKEVTQPRDYNYPKFEGVK